ncbi:DNA replication factor Cdt1-like [Patiria miniata]|uniref:CDT1 Geminin-binding domain-containing protein n=1 Tax=Patiria miniata TaxID=46514 RepID=A0A914AW31_PATMI|nr:DNA replication factor Cdt1-like [Patiria miniata]
MAQVKVTSYYTRRKRIDDAQPTKRRKLQPSASGQETDLGPEQSGLKLKAGLDAFTKQLLPQVDRAVLLEDTISQCSKTSASTTRPKSAKKSRASATRTAKKATKGPLDKHLEKVTQSESPKLKLGLSLELKTDFGDSVKIPEFVTHRSPPSTPTKRPKQTDEAPSRKKRSRIGSEDVVVETDGSSCQMTKEAESSRASRRKVQAAGRQASKRTNGGRSAKKSLEASLGEFANSNELDTRDRILPKVETPHHCVNDDSHGITTDRQESSQPSTPVNPEKSTAASSSRSSSVSQKMPDSSQSSRDSGKLQAFMERTSRSVASVNSKGSKVKAGFSDRVQEAVSNAQSSPSEKVVDSGSASEEKKKTKLTPAEMKERLSKSCKLSDLQARLARVRQCADQAKSSQKPATAVNSDIATSTREPTASKIKSEEPAMPAYQKYHALVNSAPTTLNLPFKYKLLEEMFRSTDTVVSMLHNRSETCSFPKLKQAVQEMCRRTFEQQHLGQIKTVYPTAYFLRQQKVGRSGVKEKTNYELVLEANTGSGVGTSAGQESSEPTKTKSQTNAVSKLISKFTPSMLIARRSIFHNNLVDIIKEHHNEFLSKLERPLSVPSDKLTRWHPKFPLDQIPDVEPAALPQPPTVTTYNTAKDVLDKARVMMNPRVAKALEVVAKNSALLKAEKGKPTAEQETSIVKQEPKVVKNVKSVSGVNQSLLDRIRAKEAQNVTAMMTRSPADQERITMLERLPELCRILRVFFIAEKKAAIPIEAVIQKLADSYPSILSKAQVEKHVSLMVEVLPQWLSRVVVRKDHYLKMNRTKDMSLINDRINQLLKESKQVKG